MKALSVKQPYADLIATGRKTVELRTWNTTRRGDFIICSSKRGAKDATGLQGYALAVCQLLNTRKATPEDAIKACHAKTGGLYAWEIRVVYRFKEPFPVTGQQGFFNLEIPAPQAKEYSAALYYSRHEYKGCAPRVAAAALAILLILILW